MNHTEKTLSGKAGLPPGALIHVGKRKTDKTQLSIIDYSPTDFSALDCKNTEACLAFKDKASVSWINLNGLHNTDLIGTIGNHFELHPLLVEDILNTRHRPKIEDFESYLFITLKSLAIDKSKGELMSEQVSFVLGNTWVISFQEQKSNIFNSLRQNIKESKGKIRQKGADYLLYRLIDTVVDNYFFITEHFSETTELLVEKVLHSPDQNTLHEIQQLKKQLIHFRKVINPLREAIAALQKDTSPLINENTSLYLHDVYEHVLHINDSIETLRESIASIMDLYLSGVSNKMNQIMQILTLIATIFIPLTFIAGIYGMNFDYMPELHWKYGYFTIWGIMLVTIAIMVGFFKRKNWL